jgi:hypothetical protein
MPVRMSPYTRATNYSTLNVYVPQTGVVNNCNNTLCYTYNHNYISAPHSGVGNVGRSAQGYLFCRKRL